MVPHFSFVTANTRPQAVSAIAITQHRLKRD